MTVNLRKNDDPNIEASNVNGTIDVSVPATTEYPTVPLNPIVLGPNYSCPKHGEVRFGWMSIHINGTEIGVWCLQCYAEALDNIGVSRVTKQGG